MDRPTCRCLPKRGRRPPATENPDGFVEYARKSFEIVTEPTRSASRLCLRPLGRDQSRLWWGQSGFGP